MKPLIALACAVFIAGGVQADPYSAAIRQAKDVSGRVTDANRQLMNDPSTAPSPQNQPVNPALQATLENITNLQSDFSTLSRLTNSVSIAAEKQGLTNDLNTAAQGTKPPAESISKLADDLAAAIAGNDKFVTPPPTLAQYIHAIFNTSQLTVAQQQMIFSGVQKILVAGGASPDDATNVVNDIKTIASETK